MSRWYTKLPSTVLIVLKVQSVRTGLCVFGRMSQQLGTRTSVSEHLTSLLVGSHPPITPVREQPAPSVCRGSSLCGAYSINPDTHKGSQSFCLCLVLRLGYSMYSWLSWNSDICLPLPLPLPPSARTEGLYLIGMANESFCFLFYFSFLRCEVCTWAGILKWCFQEQSGHAKKQLCQWRFVQPRSISGLCILAKELVFLKLRCRNV